MIPSTEVERQHQLISQITALEHGIALFNCIDSRIKVIDNKPMKINTENVRSDIRYNIGYMDALKWVLKQPKKAQEFLNNI